MTGAQKANGYRSYDPMTHPDDIVIRLSIYLHLYRDTAFLG